MEVLSAQGAGGEPCTGQVGQRKHQLQKLLGKKAPREGRGDKKKKRLICSWWKQSTPTQQTHFISILLFISQPPSKTSPDLKNGFQTYSLQTFSFVFQRTPPNLGVFKAPTLSLELAWCKPASVHRTISTLTKLLPPRPGNPLHVATRPHCDVLV